MLLNLEILNGKMSIKFDKYVNNYSIKVDENVDYLVMDYEVSEGYTIDIINNSNLEPGYNYVYIEVKNDLEVNSYILEVYKEEVNEVINYENYLEELNVVPKNYGYTKYIIGIIAFLIIIILFYILFIKRKKGRK